MIGTEELMNKPELIDAQGLAAALEADDGDLLLIDVRLSEDFDDAHLPGAKSNCVFDVDFMEELSGLSADTKKRVCVYGAHEGSHEARMAAEKLRRAGFSKVWEFRDGIRAWEKQGFGLEGKFSGSPAPPVISDGVHAINLKESRIEWLGRNLLNKHWGSAGIRRGEITFRGGVPVFALFSIDMTDLSCDDLRGDPLHDVLITHLQSDDFFDVTRFPKAVFEIDSFTPIENSSPGAPNYHASGNLTLRGITEPVEFDLVAGITGDGKAAAQASFAIDRTRWEVIYGSGKLFHRLANHLVNDLIEFQIRIVTE